MPDIEGPYTVTEAHDASPPLGPPLDLADPLADLGALYAAAQDAHNRGDEFATVCMRLVERLAEVPITHQHEVESLRDQISIACQEARHLTEARAEVERLRTVGKKLAAELSGWTHGDECPRAYHANCCGEDGGGWDCDEGLERADCKAETCECGCDKSQALADELAGVLAST